MRVLGDDRCAVGLKVVGIGFLFALGLLMERWL